PASPAAPTSLLEMDLNGIIIHWHAQAELLYGYTPEEMEGQSIATLFSSETEIARLYDEMRSADRAGFDTIHKTKSGHTVPVHVEFQQISSGPGERPTIGLLCHRRMMGN